MTSFINLLKEAAADSNVASIKMTLYRVAKNSQVVEALIDAAENGKEVVVTGAIRSMDTSKNPNKHHNVNYIVADEVEILEEQVPEGDINEVEFIARSCTREPYAKLTPVTHKKVLNLFVAIPRDFSERADFIRCTLWGKGADLAVDVKRNDYIKVTGRLMSRDVYVNGEETESVYEISVKEMEKLENEE